ncbi:MAG: glutamine--fructose-6-phosphate transaminase (isomerizing) [Acidobacteriota bacterium]|jgi:glucosamine--fructose-6-phosphate aminotransferase (isomerizing)
MCGIIGYIGRKDVVPVLVDGLKRLEYRGYDSAGVAVVEGGELRVRRSAGKLRELEDSLRREPLTGLYGIGHTRWATHGRPTEENAHPHRDCTGRIIVVHNGIIENYLELKQRLRDAGHRFTTETDTEIIAHLLEEAYDGSLEKAMQAVLPQLEGIYALACLSTEEENKIVGARMGPPLVAGVGEDEYFVASDITAILSYTRDVLFLDDGEIVVAEPGGVRILGADGSRQERAVQRVTWDPIMAEKGGYKHFMLKEIFEQPRAIRDTLAGRFSLDDGRIYLEEIEIAPEELREIRKINLVACGTSWHACLVGKFLIESMARIPVEVDYGSEFRYRSPLIDDGCLTVVVTQSGETADTLAALREAKRCGARSVAICNVMGSMVTREANGTLLTHAGPEIGVASTKAFTAQLVALDLLALYLAQVRGVMNPARIQAHLQELTHIPSHVEKVLTQDHKIEELAKTFFEASDFLFLGRGINYPVALEGALKLKEISYIHAEGYPAGEMKHGPIALIDPQLPVVALAPDHAVYEKMVANMEEVKARDGILIAVATEGNRSLEEKADHVLYVPSTEEALTPIVAIVPLQMLAYHIALKRGCDVDQPRNLAKSVTVE